MRFFVKVKFRLAATVPGTDAKADTGKVITRVYMCPSAKARDAIKARFGYAASDTKRGWLSTHFGQLEPFGRQYWGAAIPAGIPKEIQDAHPGIYRVIKAAKGSTIPNIDRMQEPSQC